MDRKKILIIDDAKDFVRIMSLQLRAKNYDVVCATDAVTAISTAQQSDN